jgi:transglutaminase-like putative cysteine protease
MNHPAISARITKSPGTGSNWRLTRVSSSARYCTGHLADIGVPVGLGDFAAWFEVYLDGRWYIFDPRNNMRRIGRVLIARGPDAAHVALSNSFGPSTLVSFRVWAEEVDASGRVLPSD